MANINAKSNNIKWTTLDNEFIDGEMLTAPPVFSLIYIFCHSNMLRGINITTEMVAEKFSILESDVLKAINYWNEKGILQCEFSENKPVDTKIEEIDEKENKIKPIILESKPNYTTTELEIYKTQSEEVNYLFTLAEKMMGKMLSYNDLNILFGIYDWLRMPIVVIEILLTYCAENEHRSARYIEKVAIDWMENGIDTPEKASNHIELFRNDFYQILKACGQSNRNPTDTEIKYMKKWLKEFEMPLDLILEACDKTIMQIGKPKFSYIDTIIKNWNQAGLKTIDEINNLDSEFYKNQEAKANSKVADKKSKKPVKQNRFVNFTQREWDFEALEELERQNNNVL